MSSIKILGNRVMVKEYEDSGVTKSGIFIINPSSQKTTREGEVVAVGTGKTTVDGYIEPINDVKVGDSILYTNYSGIEIEIDEEKYTILEYRDILSIVENI